MDIGMLPPKLAQMMINISGNSKDENIALYDPFV
jgi:tRNA G10  N-methylase Trm11